MSVALSLTLSGCGGGAGGGGQCGTNNEATGQNAFVGCGSDNIASGDASFVGSGEGNRASGASSWIPGGIGASTRGITGAYAWAVTYNNERGDIQRFGHQATAFTSDTTPTVATSGFSDADATNVLVLPDKSAWSGIIQVVAVDQDDNRAKWTFDVLAGRGSSAATTTIDDVHVIRQSISPGLSGVDVDVLANTTLGALTVQVTGLAGTQIIWWVEAFGGLVVNLADG